MVMLLKGRIRPLSLSSIRSKIRLRRKIRLSYAIFSNVNLDGAAVVPHDDIGVG
jgi:hypothetical protein